LAVTSATRWNDLPDIPTMVEAGYKDFVFDTYTALMAPAKTPPDIIARLEKTSLDILHRTDMSQRLLQQGFEVQAKDGKTHMARVTREVAMFREIIAQAGIKQM
jgi:tripartite-type tricarboxylate transporter receptor subunit TctC